MLTRGQTKRILRQATQMRIRAERSYLTDAFEGIDGDPAPFIPRVEEPGMLKLLKTTPSVFAFAEKLNSDYERPFWASHRYGAK
jgi:hypothetical protein